MSEFKLHSPFKPAGDQPQAINELTDGILAGDRFQTLLGITGSGKTRTVASVIEQVQRPTLVMSHNKTLAAQLYRELSDFFPENRVEFFISYYDYYQPEAYISSQDKFIEKDLSINEEIHSVLGYALPAHYYRDVGMSLLFHQLAVFMESDHHLNTKSSSSP